MEYKIFSYPVQIKEVYLDTFGHMNNAMYLALFEEARWEVLHEGGYGIDKIIETGLGPTILELDVRFIRELRLRDEVIITTQLISYQKKICKIANKMIRGNEECCTAEFTLGLFDMKQRKLVLPTPEWLRVFS